MIEKKNFLMTSLDIAKYTKKLHKNILRDIREEITKWSLPYDTHFIETFYVRKTNEARPMYNITREGVIILIHRYQTKGSVAVNKLKNIILNTEKENKNV